MLNVAYNNCSKPSHFRDFAQLVGGSCVVRAHVKSCFVPSRGVISNLNERRTHSINTIPTLQGLGYYDKHLTNLLHSTWIPSCEHRVFDNLVPRKGKIRALTESPMIIQDGAFPYEL